MISAEEGTALAHDLPASAMLSKEANVIVETLAASLTTTVVDLALLLLLVEFALLSSVEIVIVVIRAASLTTPVFPHIKRCVAEMLME